MTTIHFSRAEAACKCGCGFAAMDWELVDVLEDIRKFFGKTIFVNSWCRCMVHNQSVGGAKNSYHVRAMAADITVNTVPAATVADYLESKYKNGYGIGRYPDFTHIDMRAKKARWGATNGS